MVGPADRAMHGSAQIGAPAAADAPHAPAQNEAPAEIQPTEPPAEPQPEPAPAPAPETEPAPAPEQPADEPVVDDVALGDPDSGTGEVPTNPGSSDGVIIPNPTDPPADPPMDPAAPTGGISADGGYEPAPKS